MEQQSFDASNILSKLRQNRPSYSPSHSGNQHWNSGKGRQSPSGPRFHRKERSEVRIELENEVDFLTNEVVRLKRENNKLHMEKEELEYKCADLKEKADITISKLRNKLVALNKKFIEVGTISNKDKYNAKKNLHKSFSKGAGVLNITNSIPSTVPTVNPASSVQSLTFSRFMKHNSHNDENSFHSSLRQYPNSSNQQQQHDLHDFGQSLSSINHNEGPISSQYEASPEEYEDYRTFSKYHHSPPSITSLHGTNKPYSVGEGSRNSRQGVQQSPLRSTSGAPPKRCVDESKMEDINEIIDNGCIPQESSLVIENNEPYENDRNDDSFLPVVDIDLRNA